MPDSVTILIVGTDRTGTTIGLALRKAGASFQRIGFDPDPKRLRQARDLGAIDREATNLARAAPDADLAIVTLDGGPAAEAGADLAGRLRPDTVVLATSRLQTATLDSLRSRLAPQNPVLGAVPFVGPRQVLGLAAAAEEPTADAFEGGLLGVVLPPGSPEASVEICLDLAAILGTTPFFLDAAEVDSLAATSEEMPSVVAATFLASLTSNPGWRDQRRLVGPVFAQLTGLVEADPDGFARELIANRVNVLARLEAFTAAADDLREILEARDEKLLTAHLTRALGVHQDWRAVRGESRPDHGVELPGMPRVGMLDRLLGRGPRPVRPPS